MARNEKKSDSEKKLIEYEKQIYDLKQILKISQILNSSLDYNHILESILYICMGQLKVLNIGIFIKKSPEQKHFTFHRDYKGYEIDHSYKYRIPEKHELVKYLKEKGRALTLKEIQKIIKENSLGIIDKVKPELFVPLLSKNEIYGIIILSKKIEGGAFNRSEKEYIMEIAEFAAIAIQNSFLFEMATTDMTTGLKLKHYFKSVFLQHQEEIKKQNCCLSLLMIDIDHFKNFNDTYGHLVGDQVLKKVAQTIKNSIRKADLAARYGGEEFSVLLPKSNIETAKKVAERIRTSIHEQKIKYLDELIGVTVSIGISEYNHSIDKTIESLINRADSALYRAKNNGRNQVQKELEDKS